MKIAHILFLAFLSLLIYACSGTDVDCDILGFNIGDLCNDGNGFTFDDIVLDNCICAGTKFDPGYPCDDGDDLTEDDMLDDDCNCVGTPTYVKTVKPILDTNCATNSNCHGAGSVTTFPMSNYDEAVTAVGFGRIIGAINHNTGFQEMPRGANKLDQDSINYIIAWIEGGTPECGIDLFVGDACDDDDEDTLNDAIAADCTCVGFECPDLNLNIGDPCDDFDDNTLVSTVDDDCNCVGMEITYTNNVKAILDSSCATNTACHASGSVVTFPMSIYDEAVTAAGFGRIIGAINHEASFDTMPRGADKLDQALIDAITIWINTGTPE